MKPINFLLAALIASTGVNAQTASDDHATHHQSSVSTSPVLAEQAGAPGAVATTEGEVRKVDKDAEKLTIKHGSIANLDMPGMTMVFRVSDPAMLDSVKPGDKVRFIVDRIGGLFTVTKIEPVQ